MFFPSSIFPQNTLHICRDKENLGNYVTFCPKFSNGQFGKTATQSTKLFIMYILTAFLGFLNESFFRTENIS